MNAGRGSTVAEYINMFSGIVGNPPYQEDVSKKQRIDGTKTGVTKEIWAGFLEVSKSISTCTSLITPGSWVKNLSKAPGNLIADSRLKVAYRFLGYEVFGSQIEVEFPLTLLLSGGEGDGEVLRGRFGSIDLSCGIFCDTPGKKEALKASQRWGGSFLSPPVSLSDWTNVETVGEGIFSKKELPEGLKIYLKKRPGKQPDGSWWYVEKEQWAKAAPGDDLTKYSVAIMSRVLGRVSIWEHNVERGAGDIQPMVYAPFERYGTTWVQMRSFDNETEANMFRLYLKTPFVTSLIGMSLQREGFASLVPDLEDYSTANSLFQELPEEESSAILTINARLMKMQQVPESCQELLQWYPEPVWFKGKKSWLDKDFERVLNISKPRMVDELGFQ